MDENIYVRQLNQVGLGDVALAGGKNASLGEMIQHLSKMDIRIPNGFLVTVPAYEKFMEENALEPVVSELIEKIDFDDTGSLSKTGSEIRRLIKNAIFPSDIKEIVSREYFWLSRSYGVAEVDVAVRSSAIAEDMPDASFAGQQDTYLNVRGIADLIEAVQNCFASLFTDRAISYRKRLGYDRVRPGISVCVQKMVRSDLAVSGVAFTLDPETGFRNVIVINGSYGLGEMVVQGSVSPDEFVVFKTTLNERFSPIIEKKLGVKDKRMVYAQDRAERVKIVETSAALQDIFCLRDEEILKLAEWVVRIEKYYSEKLGRWCPMDIEWAIDGESKELFIVQARPETVHSSRRNAIITTSRLLNRDDRLKPIVTGIAIGHNIGTGSVNIVHTFGKGCETGVRFSAGDVLVTDMTDPDWEPIMKKAAAIITNKGGRTCHAAIVAREMGVPAIIGCGNATEKLQNGQLITVSCAEGEQGAVFDGILAFEQKEVSLKDVPAVQTSIMLNLGSPALAFQYASLPHKGVGLAREEFIINNYIKVHPLALLHHGQLGDRHLSSEIRMLVRGFVDEEDYFIKKLSYGIAKIAAAFYPEKVIVRFSDFKSNEYVNLLGGEYYEPDEENPMIGWRGASRYYSEKYRQAFALECSAVKFVRETMGLENVVVMIPFCRTVGELEKVKEVMAESGLRRGERQLELYLMAELPSNIILAREFAEHVDGFSIGSNDLTQLTLGVDRDSALVAHLYNERDDAVKALIAMLIKVAKESGVKVGICGQAPSDFPEFTQFLVEQGIDSISVTPDSFYKTIHLVHELERKRSGDSHKIVMRSKL